MSDDKCPQCGVSDRLKPRWFGVPRNLFILNGRVRAKGADGGSVRVYGWSIQREWYPTMFGRSVRHVDRIVCPHEWHFWPEEEKGEPFPLPRLHKTAEERKTKKLIKRRRGDVRGWR